ncbi:biotin--[acetyl-CoA-carboxylase] ligase [Oscillibacter sp.]|uniref:biotin--[acetyl-CoA-carboxylase] ligase n=1 Tax=Oscillibacter sp. TaxID=1945593 RepID=UPI002D7F6195|nr:biotin--[acetyl-CoA-carboxylase] ligase [Oscillibacter sp.]
MSSREAVLSLLRGEEGFLSGQELSRRLGLSRAAVWKAVDALRAGGYEIEARTGLGYRLTAAPDLMTEAEIRSFLGETAIVGRELRCFEELDSTSNYLKSWTDGPDGAAVTAESQTAGRGRMDRSFQSPRGQGIYLSVLLRPALPPDRLPPATALAGVAVCDAVERVCGARPGLKWPNDPVLNGKKLCGILTELSLEAETGRVQSLVLGIGVNVGQREEDFSPEVREVATSLLQVLGKPVSRPRLTAALLEELDRAYAALLAGDLSEYLAAYRRRCVNLGKTVQLIPFGGGPRETAQAVDIDGDFGLVVRGTDGRERAVRSGEVSVRGLWGYTE